MQRLSESRSSIRRQDPLSNSYACGAGRIGLLHFSRNFCEIAADCEGRAEGATPHARNVSTFSRR
jgi:hypothetical protein